MNNFKSFEILERKYSPNAIMGIRADGSKQFILAPVPTLGKKIGDEFVNAILAFLNYNVLTDPKPDEEESKFGLVSQMLAAEVQCPKCHNCQKHTYPMSGRLYCNVCGELLDQIYAEE
jgi:ribosomal protein S27E